MLMSYQHSTTINNLYQLMDTYGITTEDQKAKVGPSLTASGPSAREVSLKVGDVAAVSVTQQYARSK